MKKFILIHKTDLFPHSQSFRQCELFPRCFELAHYILLQYELHNIILQKNMSDINIVYDYHNVYIPGRAARMCRRQFERADPREGMLAKQIKQVFRFSNENIDKIINLTR